MVLLVVFDARFGALPGSTSDAALARAEALRAHLDNLPDDFRDLITPNCFLIVVSHTASDAHAILSAHLDMAQDHLTVAEVTPQASFQSSSDLPVGATHPTAGPPLLTDYVPLPSM